MWKALKGALQGLVGSKKFVAAFISAVTWGVGKFGVQLDAAELYPLVVPIWGYVLAQAGADWSKAAAELKAGTAADKLAEESKPK